MLSASRKRTILKAVPLGIGLRTGWANEDSAPIQVLTSRNLGHQNPEVSWTHRSLEIAGPR